MIKRLFKNSDYGFPLVSVILLVTCCIVTIPTAFQHELYYVFAMQSKPFFFWQAFSGIFEHSMDRCHRCRAEYDHKKAATKMAFWLSRITLVYGDTSFFIL